MTGAVPGKWQRLGSLLDPEACRLVASERGFKLPQAEQFLICAGCRSDVEQYYRDAVMAKAERENRQRETFDLWRSCQSRLQPTLESVEERYVAELPSYPEAVLKDVMRPRNFWGGTLGGGRQPPNDFHSIDLRQVDMESSFNEALPKLRDLAVIGNHCMLVSTASWKGLMAASFLLLVDGPLPWDNGPPTTRHFEGFVTSLRMLTTTCMSDGGEQDITHLFHHIEITEEGLDCWLNYYTVTREVGGGFQLLYCLNHQDLRGY
jgi:hypothetical protein